MKIEFALPVEEHERWSQSAVDGLVGQTPLMHGRPCTVLRAWLVGGRPFVEVETEPSQSGDDPDGAS